MDHLATIPAMKHNSRRIARARETKKETLTVLTRGRDSWTKEAAWIRIGATCETNAATTMSGSRKSNPPIAVVLKNWIERRVFFTIMVQWVIKDRGLDSATPLERPDGVNGLCEDP